MSQLQAGLVQVPLTPGCQVVWEAINPTTGAQVAGVTVTNPTVYGRDLTAGAEQGASTIADVEPLFLPLPVE